jgi:YebC/PmpR family DNA-binding regulatory protein
MSGHSKWATTKHRKAAQDAKRSALFSKLARMVTVAAKNGGDPNPENNAALAAAVEKAKSYSLPKDKIQTAIDKAFGVGSDASSFEETVYEGYGPSGIAIYVEALTDNKNRTAADVRSAFTRAGGSLGTSGSVAFQFERKGQITVVGWDADEDELMLLVADAGGEDLQRGDDEWLVYTGPSEVMAVRSALDDAGVRVKGVELVMEPSTTTAVPIEDARKVLRLVDALEDYDDVQNVYHTLEFSDELAAALDV